MIVSGRPDRLEFDFVWNDVDDFIRGVVVEDVDDIAAPCVDRKLTLVVKRQDGAVLVTHLKVGKRTARAVVGPPCKE